MAEENYLEDCILKSIAGFKQSLIFSEKAESYLKTKERLSAREFFLHRCFFVPHRHYGGVPKKLMELMKKSEDIESFYRQLLDDSFDKIDYQRLVGLEEKLNLSKEKGEAINLVVTTWSGEWDDLGPAGRFHKTIYSPIKVKDWYFRENKLHIVPDRTYCCKTEDIKNYPDEGFSVVRCSEQNNACNEKKHSVEEIIVEDPHHKIIELNNACNEKNHSVEEIVVEEIIVKDPFHLKSEHQK